jgi:hypothetical protein
MKKITKILVGTLCAFALTTSTAFAFDGKVPGEAWTVSLGGVGSTVTRGDVGTAFGADLSIGRTGKSFLPVEGGIRQGISYDGNSTTLATTKLYIDWTLLTVKKVDVFAGGNVGVTYGNTKPQWEIAPEAGLRWWVKNDVAVLARTEVPFDLDGWGFKDTVRYFLGFSVKF